MSRIKSGNKDLNTLKKEDVVQAVIIGDNFNDAFSPMTTDLPSCLIPLGNRCLLDHNLEWLSDSGVQEAFLFCCRHADKVKEYIKNSKWTSSISKLSVNIIVSETCQSLGDAMRDLDAKGLIRGDFILVMGDTIANINLLPILEKHRKLQKADKGLAMTLVYKYAGPSHVARAPQDDVVLAADKATGKVLFHQKRVATADSRKVYIPMETILERGSVDIYNDLLDTLISVCSASVLPLFSDNFDFQTREDFIKGLLMNEEILASSLAWYCLGDGEYAASVNSWHQYRCVTKNMIHRWTYPIVPDLYMNDNEDAYVYLSGNVYKQTPVKFSRGCTVEEDSIVGGHSSIGESSHISRSVVGRNCQIGNCVTIEDSFIWNNCIIEDGCSIKKSVVGMKCIVRKNAVLSEGSILGPGVECPAGYQCNQRLQALPGDNNVIKIGPAAFALQPENNESDSDDGGFEEAWSDLYPVNIPDEDVNSDGCSESENDSVHSSSPIPDDTNLFYSEVMDSLNRGFEDKLHCDNLILEINSSRYAYNVSMREVNLLVVKAILNLPKPKPEPYFPQLWPLLSYFSPILVNYVRNPTAQLDCLQALKEVSLTQKDVLPGVSKVLNFLYDKDILSEETITQWYNDLEEDPDTKQLRSSARPFITWLEQAEEESESDNESS